MTTDAAGTRSAASTYASVGNGVTTVPDEPEEPESPVEPEPQEATEYGFVSVPGNFNSAVGCPGDWQPDCANVQMEKVDGIWRLTLAELTAGSYNFKIATEKSWTENYGAGGVANGGDIALTHAGGAITFYFDPRTKNIRTTADGPIVTLAGSFQSELGCAGDWAPSCLAAMMFDRNADGVFQFTTDDLPTGSYAVKVTHGLSWDENYGVGGAPGGGDISFTASAGEIVAFLYDIESHVLTVQTANPPLAGVGELRAHWIDADTIAWPSDLGSTAAGATWQLYSSADATLAVTDGEVTGGDPIDLTVIETGLTDAQKQALPGPVVVHRASRRRGHGCRCPAHGAAGGRAAGAATPSPASPACRSPACSTTSTPRPWPTCSSASAGRATSPRSASGLRPPSPRRC